MSEAFAIDVRGLTKKYGERVVVDHVDLQVRTGTICGFLGPSLRPRLIIPWSIT